MKLCPFGARGDESMLAYAILSGTAFISESMSRKEQLAFAYGYYLGRKEENRADWVLKIMEEEQ